MKVDEDPFQLWIHQQWRCGCLMHPTEVPPFLICHHTRWGWMLCMLSTHLLVCYWLH